MRLKIAVFSILSSCLAIFLVDLWLETSGLPTHWRAEVLQGLQAEGLVIESQAMRVGLVNGLIMTGVTVATEEEPDNLLLEADSVQVRLSPDNLLAGQLSWSSLQVRGLNASVPLATEAGRRHLSLSNGQLQLTNFRNSIELKTLQGHCGTVFLRVSGQLLKPTEEDETEVPLDLSGLTRQLEEGFSDLPGPVREALLEFGQVCQQPPPQTSSLTVHVQVPLDDVGRGRGDAQLELQSLLWRGLAVERLAVRGSLTPQRIDLSDVRLVLNNQEHVRGSVSISLPELLVNMDVSSRFFPSRLLKIVSNELLDSTYYPRFQGAPPFWMLEVRDSPLEDFGSWTVEAYTEVKDVIVQQGHIASGRATLGFDKGLFWLKDFRAVMADRTVCTVDLRYHIPADRLTLNAVIDGSPRSVVQVTDSPALHRMSDTAWQWFEWQPDAPPHIELTLHRYQRESEPQITLLAGMRMRSFSFRGQAVDAARASLLLDGSDRVLVVKDLRVVRNGRRGGGALAFHFGDRKSLRYELDSRLEPQVLLGLIRSQWQEDYAKLSLDTERGLHVLSRGWVNLEDPVHSRAVGTISVPAVEVPGGLEAQSVHARLRYQDGRLEGPVTVGSVSYEQWQGDQLAAELLTDFERLSVGGHLDRVSRDDLSGNDLDFQLELADGTVKGDLKIATGKVGSGGASYEIESAQFRNIELSAASLTAEASIRRVSGETLAVDEVEGQLNVEAGVARLAGRTGAILAHDQAQAPSGEFRLLIGEEQPLVVAAVVPEIRLKDNLRIDGLQLQLTERGGGYRGVARATSARLRERLRLTDVLTDLDIQGGLVRFRANAGQLEAGALMLRDVTFSGSGSAGTVVADISSANGLVLQKFQVTDLRSALTFQESRLAFNYLTAKAYDGRLKGNIQIDVDRDNGQAYVVAEDLQLQQLPQMTRPQTEDRINPNVRNKQGDRIKLEDRIRGRLSGQASLMFSQLGGDLQIHGDGEAMIREGQVFRLPVLADFLDLVNSVNVLKPFISTGDFGAITALDTSFRFQGDRIHFDPIKTNGSLLALSGGGYYWWKTKGLDFRIQAQLLKKIIPVPFTSPFRVFLDRRAVGTLGNMKWEKLSALRDVFRDAETPVDPTGTSGPGAPTDNQAD